MNEKKLSSFNLDKELHKKLKIFCKNNGVGMSSVVNTIIHLYLNDAQRELKYPYPLSTLIERGHSPSASLDQNAPR